MANKVFWLRPVREPQEAPTSVKQARKWERGNQTRTALRWLAARYPVAFPGEVEAVHPLATGIRDAVLAAGAAEPDAPDPALLVLGLQVWTRSSPYLVASAAGRDRLNLDGTVAGPIDPEHQSFAKDRLDEINARHARRKAERDRKAAVQSASAGEAVVPVPVVESPKPEASPESSGLPASLESPAKRPVLRLRRSNAMS